MKRKMKVTGRVVFEGEVTAGCEEAVIAFLAAHLRNSPLSIKDKDGNELSAVYTGGGKFKVELEP